MKSYKDYIQDYIGSSDVAALTAIGFDGHEVAAKVISFGGDDAYMAYIVDENAAIGDHYSEVARFKSWAKIVDDSEMQKFYADEIVIYRAGEYGCIIQLIGRQDG